jgi:probable poly-beta-1,6-N-acetyl-D-glucosamine export protein
VTQKDYLNYIHNFRGVAILFIVFIHIATSMSWKNPVSERISLILFTNGTILFVFIAGFIFYHLNHIKFDYFIYLKKRLSFVLLPYVLISIPAVLDKLYFDQVGDHWWYTSSFADESVLYKIVHLLVTGYHNGVLWFIPMVTIIYILTKPTIALAKSNFFEAFAPMIFILGLFVNSFGYRSNVFFSFLYFFPVFIFGIWVYKMRNRLCSNWKLILSGMIISYCLLSYLEYWDIIPFDRYLKLRDTNEFIFGFNLNKMKLYMLCILLLLFFKNIYPHSNRVLKILGDYSFGIFFIHLYYIIIIRYVINTFFSVYQLDGFLFLILGIITVLVSVVSVYGVKIIFGNKSRYLIGS